MTWYCSDCGLKNTDDRQKFKSCGAGIGQNEQEDFLLVDRYRIDKVLKSGGMGCVFKAYDTQGGNVVAIKEMLVKSTDPEDEKYAQEKFLQEVNFLAKLDHPSLPGVTDFFVTREKNSGRMGHYLVMTYIEGKDLETYMHERGNRPAPVGKTLEWFTQTLEILDYLHSNIPPIIFRDLKPANLILKNDRVYLVDFGIARVYQPGKPGTVIGTPGYAAPEQYQGLSEPRSDIYSLGVMMHYLLTGRDPEDEDRQAFSFDKIDKVNPDVSEGISNLISSMLALKLNKRPHSTREVIKKLNRLTGFHKDHEYSDKPRGIVEQTASMIFRNAIPGTDSFRFKTVMLLMGVVLVFLMGGVGGFFFLNLYNKATPKRKKELSSVFKSPSPSSTKARQLKIPVKIPGGKKIHYAVIKNNRKEVERLLNAGIDVNMKTTISRDTPLHIACFWDRRDIAALLIEKGADLYNPNKKGFTPMETAIKADRRETVKLLVKNGYDLDYKRGNYSRRYYKPALHKAAEWGRLEIIRILIENGAPVDSMGPYQRSPLHFTCLKGDLKISKFLVEKGAIIHLTDKKGHTPFHLACYSGNKNLVTYLIENGAMTHIASRRGWLPIHYAAYGGSVETVKLLLDKGAKPDSMTIGAYNCRGFTPLHFAVLSGDPGLVEFLINKGADVNHQINTRHWKRPTTYTPLELTVMSRYYVLPIGNKNDKFSWDQKLKNKARIARLLIDAGADKNITDRRGNTLMHKAVRNNRPGIVNVLIAGKYDLNVKNKRGETPLDLAIRLRSRKITRMLEKAGAETPLSKDNSTLKYRRKYGFDFKYRGRLINSKSREAERLLLDAVKSRNRKQTELLLKYGVNPNCKGPGGERPLDIATRKYSRPVITVLQRYGAKADQIRSKKLSILHGTSLSGNLSMAKSAVSRGADVNAKDSSGKTPLHLSAKKRDLKMVAFLLENGADGNAEDDAGKTPLIYTVQHCLIWRGRRHYRANDYKVISLLLKKGANINHLDKKGCSALAYSIHPLRKDIMHFLLKNGAQVNNFRKIEFSPIAKAVNYNDVKAAEILMKKGAKISTGRKRTTQLIHLTAKKGKTKAVKFLTKYGADINAKDENGKKPIDLAVEQNRIETVDALVKVMERKKTGAGMDAYYRLLYRSARKGDQVTMARLHHRKVDLNGLPGKEPVIHIAAKKGHREFVKSLVNKGVNPNVKYRGMTPMDRAVMNDYDDTARAIKRKGGKMTENGRQYILKKNNGVMIEY